MPAATIDSATFYRRQARRLRHDLRDEPAKLHRSLQALSQWHNLSPPTPTVWKRETRTNHVQDLIAATVNRMEGPVLRYPARVALLKQAHRAGLPHFDANLIIASVQHRMGERHRGELPNRSTVAPQPRHRAGHSGVDHCRHLLASHVGCALAHHTSHEIDGVLKHTLRGWRSTFGTTLGRVRGGRSRSTKHCRNERPISRSHCASDPTGRKDQRHHHPKPKRKSQCEITSNGGSWLAGEN